MARTARPCIHKGAVAAPPRHLPPYTASYVSVTAHARMHPCMRACGGRPPCKGAREEGSCHPEGTGTPSAVPHTDHTLLVHTRKCTHTRTRTFTATVASISTDTGTHERKHARTPPSFARHEVRKRHRPVHSSPSGHLLPQGGFRGGRREQADHHPNRHLQQNVEKVHHTHTVRTRHGGGGGTRACARRATPPPTCISGC